jgi:hypothetical protein
MVALMWATNPINALLPVQIHDTIFTPAMIQGRFRVVECGAKHRVISVARQWGNSALFTS